MCLNFEQFFLQMDPRILNNTTRIDAYLFERGDSCGRGGGNRRQPICMSVLDSRSFFIRMRVPGIMASQLRLDEHVKNGDLLIEDSIGKDGSRWSSPAVIHRMITGSIRY
mmetsp:Transcript_10242/g.15682  ORF Transcript_10242/g.15682 Transcript_10242/m.15682 type:complete len:110 (+) Transcript_10242:123-452(+)